MKLKLPTSPRAPLLLFLLLPVLLAPACGGGGTGDGVPPPTTIAPRNLVYAETVAVYEPETSISPNVPSWDGGAPTTFEVAPALPAGLALDPATGVLGGATTNALAPRKTYVVTARNAGGATTAGLTITVGAFETLAAGFEATRVAGDLAKPVRLAALPDGRILFNELDTGDTRVLREDGTLQAEVFAHTDVVTGGHRGLLGLALHPAFASNGWVYLAACVPGTGGLDDQLVVKRFTAAETTPGVLVGTNATTLVDQIPVAVINNAGDLAFDRASPSPHIFLSVGDQDDDANAQEIAGLAGRIHRYTDAGAVPADNPGAPDDPTWCLGLRNTFALGVQPNTGDLWGGDNGPASNDGLDFLRAGKNFGWGGLPPGTPPGNVGIQVRVWQDVIVPTALCWHDGTGWGADVENDLFLTSYADEAVRRFRLSGLSFLDIDEEILFATFRPQGIDHKPLDIERAPDGSLLVSTFTALYRIRKR